MVQDICGVLLSQIARALHENVNRRKIVSTDLQYLKHYQNRYHSRQQVSDYQQWYSFPLRKRPLGSIFLHFGQILGQSKQGY